MLRASGLVLALLIACSTWASELPQAPPEELGFSVARLKYLDQFYAEKVKQGEMAGIVTLISRHGKIAHFSAIGYADVEKKRKMQTDTIFRLYSMTKPIAATALMILYEEGRFQMNDPLSKYIPEFANLRVLRTADAALDDTVVLDRDPSVQDALRHTTGFGNKNALQAAYAANVYGNDIYIAEMMAKLAKIPLLEQPGRKFIYGVSSDIQARLVEVLSGMPFDEFLKQRLFKPLGMKDASFLVAADKASRLATVYWTEDGNLMPLDETHGHPAEGGLMVQPRSVNGYIADRKRKGGSTGLVSTAEDYWRFGQMMLNGGYLNGVRILSPPVIRYMTRDHLATIGAAGPFNNGFGLGFAVINDPAAAGFISSEGTFYWAGAAGTQFWIDPKEDMVVVMMTQYFSSPPDAGASTLWPQTRALVYSALME